MSRNGPTGQARMPLRRHPADDPFAVPATSPPQGQWGQAPGYPDAGQQPYGYGQQQPGYGQAGYPDPNGYGQQQAQGQGYYFPQSVDGDPGQGYAPQQGQPLPFGAPQGGAPGWGPQQGDPRGFDLGNYMPASAPGQQGAEPHFQGEQYAPQQHGYGDTDAEYDETLEEDEEPRSGRRTLMIVGALVGAIGLGGAVAYTYKSFGSSGSRAPLIKNVEIGPNKVKPVTPGGKEIAYTDKKLLNRLDDAGQARQGAEPEAQDERSDDPNAPRKVRIIPISPGQQPPTAAAPSGAPAVPGIMLDNIGPPRQQQQPPIVRAQPPAQAMPPPAARAAPPPPVKVAVAVPPPPQAEALPVKKAAVPKVKEAAAPPPVTTSTSGTSGFVAVLASQKSRMDALKAFADLQQKYGDVLGSKTPDVQEANLGEKGMWYRAVVGPPGSRDGASSICSQLKTAGYVGCWVTAY